MKSAAKRATPNTVRKPNAKASPRASTKPVASSRNQVMERVVLPSPLKPRHLTYAQIRRMVAKVAPGPVIVPR